MSKLLEAFKLFLGDDELRPVMHNPFEFNGKVSATNGYALISCDKSHCDFEFLNPHTPPNVEAIIPKSNKHDILPINAVMFEKYKDVDDVDYIGEEVECDHCDGSGEVEWSYEHYERSFECPVCDGDGYESRAKEVLNGKKTFGNHSVNLNDSYFSMKLFYKLIQVQEILEAKEIILLHQSMANRGHLFRIGFCDILLMPIVYPENTLETLIIYTK